MVNAIFEAVEHLRNAERLGAMLTVVEGTDTGDVGVVDRIDGVVAGGGVWLTPEVVADANQLMDREDSRTLSYDGRRVLIDVVPPRPVMLVFGAGHVAQPLSLMARIVGFKVIVADARATFATAERFPQVDELIVGWPEDVFDHFVPDARTYVVLLSHDERFETPVFQTVRSTPIRYLGAMGSRRTHAARVERLRAEGWTESEVQQIRGPIGLDVKAKTPEETAVSILAEVIQVRYGSGSGLALAGSDTPIHIPDET